MQTGLIIKQRVLEALSILLCIAALIYLLAEYPGLPERIPTNFSAYGRKSSIFILFGLLVLMSGTFLLPVRLKALDRHVNIPWPNRGENIRWS